MKQLGMWLKYLIPLDGFLFVSSSGWQAVIALLVLFEIVVACVWIWRSIMVVHGSTAFDPEITFQPNKEGIKKVEY